MKLSKCGILIIPNTSFNERTGKDYPFKLTLGSNTYTFDQSSNIVVLNCPPDYEISIKTSKANSEKFDYSNSKKHSDCGSIDLLKKSSEENFEDGKIHELHAEKQKSIEKSEELLSDSDDSETKLIEMDFILKKETKEIEITNNLGIELKPIRYDCSLGTRIIAYMTEFTSPHQKVDVIELIQEINKWILKSKGNPIKYDKGSDHFKSLSGNVKYAMDNIFGLTKSRNSKIPKDSEERKMIVKRIMRSFIFEDDGCYHKSSKNITLKFIDDSLKKLKPPKYLK